MDPLARAVRQRLRRDHGIEAGVSVVLSSEKPRCALVPISEVGENPLDYQVLEPIIILSLLRVRQPEHRERALR